MILLQDSLWFFDLKTSINYHKCPIIIGQITLLQGIQIYELPIVNAITDTLSNNFKLIATFGFESEMIAINKAQTSCFAHFHQSSTIVIQHKGNI